MAKTMTRQRLNDLTRLYPILSQLPAKQFFIDYDEEADVLYIRFRHPANIYQSKLTDEDILLEFDRKGKWVGVTILDAARRAKGQKTG